MIIVILMVILVFNLLMLLLVLFVILLKGYGDKEDWFMCVMNCVFGGFFCGFNKVFYCGVENYGCGVCGVLLCKMLMFGVYFVLVGVMVFVLKVVLGGFVFV